MSPSLSTESILATCSDMQYVPRNHYFVSLGRTSIKSAAHKEAISNLSKGPLYHRIIAVQTVHGSRDTQLLLDLFANDPSRTLQLRAAKIVAAYALDDGIVEAASSLGALILGTLTRELKRRHRQNVIDRILESLRGTKGALFMKLLAYGTESYVSKVLFDEGVWGEVMVQAWGRYAKILPRIAYRACVKQIERADSIGWGYTVYTVLNSCLPFICCAKEAELGEGKTAVDLVKMLLAKSWANMEDGNFPNLQCVVDKYPREILPLLLAREERVSYNWTTRGYDILTVEELEALYRHTPSAIPKTSKYGFPLLPKEKRVPIFKLAENHWRQNDGSLEIMIVRSLPTEERENEARRQLHLERNEIKPTEQMLAAALLPWDEGLEANKQYIQSNDIELRAPALKFQIWGVRYQRNRLKDALELVTKHRYDNDVVRQAMLESVESLPQGMWKDEHFTTLKEIYTHAFDAADLSYGSQSSLWDLGVKLLSRFPQEFSPLMVRLVGKRAVENRAWKTFDRSVPQVSLSILEQELMPMLTQWRDKKEMDALLRFGEYFHDVLDRVPRILDLLEEAAFESLSGWQVWLTMQRIKRHEPGRVPRMVQRMLDDDLSKISIGSIENWLTMCSPELLDKYLIEFGYKGAYSNGTMQIIQFQHGKATWTPKQQELYTQTLAGAIRSKVNSDTEVQPYVKLLAELEYSEAACEGLKEFANLKEERTVVRDTAIRALGRLDEGKGVAALLEALGDSRARIAIYALRGVMLKEISPGRALGLLKKVETNKVTVQKEVVRLIGDLGAEASYDYLVEKEQDPNLHVDVRCALLGRLWNLETGDYQRKEVIFERNANHQHHAVLKTLAELPAIAVIPGKGIAIDCTELLTKLITTILAHGDAGVQMTVLNRLWSDPLPLEDFDVDSRPLQRQLESIILSSRKKLDMLAAACRAYFTHYLSSTSPEFPNTPGSAIPKLFESIVAKGDYEVLHEVFSNFIGPHVAAHLLTDGTPAANQVLGVLWKDRLCQSLCVILIFKLPGTELHPQLLRIAPTLHADALVEAENLFDVLIQAPPKDLDLGALERELWSSEDEESRRLGLATLVALGRTTEGWTAERRKMLDAYRSDASALVAEAATFVFPPDLDAGETKKGVSRGARGLRRGS